MNKETVEQLNGIPEGTQVSCAVVTGAICFVNIPRGTLCRPRFVQDMWVVHGKGDAMIFIIKDQKVALFPEGKRPHIRIDVADVQSKEAGVK